MGKLLWSVSGRRGVRPVEEFPSQQRLKAAFKDQNFEVLAVNLGQSKRDIDDFLFSLDAPVNFPILMDVESQAAIQWNVKGLPTTILLDKKGQEVLRVVGPRDWNNAENHATVSTLLNENG